jgi:glycosyltransferase involved in cell wall biosynthesis
MTKLRILLACEQSLPSEKRAGRPNFALEYLSRWGHDVTVVCPKPASESPREVEKSEIEFQYRATNIRFNYITTEFDQFSLFNRIRIMRSMIGTIRQEVRENHYDIIRSNGLIPSYASIQGAKNKVPVFGEITDVLSDQYIQFDMPFKRVAVPIVRRLQKRVASEIALASVESPIGRVRWTEIGLKKEKIVVNPNGVDTKHFAPTRIKDNALKRELGFRDDSDSILLVWHGDISKDDGIECILRSMQFLNRNFSLAIIGDGPTEYTTLLRKMVASLGLEGRVIFTGWIDYSKLPRYLNLSDIAVVPIIPTTAMNRANFFTKIREYIAMEKNIVATATEGLKSMVGESILVYVSNPFDFADLASKIRYASSSGLDEGRRQKMRVIATKIDWENIIRKDNEIMAQMVEGRVQDASDFDLKLV